MGSRRRARECALQLMYMWEYHRTLDHPGVRAFWESVEREPGGQEARDFAMLLVSGVIRRLAEVDELIRQASLNWRIDRMAMVDRNILRLATFELMEVLDTPIKVVLNEAIELSKRFGTEDSGAFVNGVLDKVGSLVRPQQKPEVRGEA
ncbi:MAG TPA: transcription antitermination factor NusB [Myxococcota bacterium]|nr:transcription antitermination factor NusB [Myxococcota bacterium]HQK51965.1 transcription antitermination factor NusB [Myxococcota bacterium]